VGTMGSAFSGPNYEAGKTFVKQMLKSEVASGAYQTAKQEAGAKGAAITNNKTLILAAAACCGSFGRPSCHSCDFTMVAKD